MSSFHFARNDWLSEFAHWTWLSGICKDKGKGGTKPKNINFFCFDIFYRISYLPSFQNGVILYTNIFYGHFVKRVSSNRGECTF